MKLLVNYIRAAKRQLDDNQLAHTAELTILRAQQLDDITGRVDKLLCDADSQIRDGEYKDAKATLELALRFLPAVPLLQVPPDPDDMNDKRSDWAQACLDLFIKMTRCDDEDAVHDLLTALQHWCDRNEPEFLDELAWATRNYRGEITPLPKTSKTGKGGKRPRVVVEVRGGVAEVAACDDGVDVTIIDHDNEGR